MLINRLGGWEKLHEDLEYYGFEAPQPRSVYRWYLRNRIPSVWVPHVLAVAQLREVDPELPEGADF